MKLASFLFILFCFNHLFSAPLDSIGVEKKNGKTYVLHQVEAKESLYSISRKYGVKVDEIKAANPDLKTDELKVGQTILIPSKFSAGSKESSVTKTHTVKKGESYYKISQKYGIDIDRLKKANNNKELKTGDVISIPSNTSAPAKETEKATDKSTDKNTNYKTHTVEAKETLFGISKKYGVEVDDIKKANPQVAEGLKVGMELKIPVKGKENSSPQKETPVKKEEPKKNVSKEKKTEVKETTVEKEKETEKEVKKEEPKKEEPTPTVKSDVPETKSSSETVKSKGGFDKIEEKGMAELMESKEDSPKFQALHRTATIGTIIQVINADNGQKIFVRVIGKLEGGNSNTIIKLSQRAMERLQAKENKISVQLSYIP